MGPARVAPVPAEVDTQTLRDIWEMNGYGPKTLHDPLGHLRVALLRRAVFDAVTDAFNNDDVPPGELIDECRTAEEELDRRMAPLPEFEMMELLQFLFMKGVLTEAETRRWLDRMGVEYEVLRICRTCNSRESVCDCEKEDGGRRRSDRRRGGSGVEGGSGAGVFGGGSGNNGDSGQGSVEGEGQSTGVTTRSRTKSSSN